MKKIRFILLISTITVLVVFLHFASNDTEALKPFKTSQVSESSNNVYYNETINILLYTPFWADPFLMKGNELKVKNTPELKSCITQNCRLTTNRSLLGSVAEFDALLFHHAHGWLVDGVFWKIPEQRSSKQFYIFAADE
jgi:Fucosyltransferase, N-terminal